MTKIQEQIVELISRLSLAERHELLGHVQEAGLLNGSFYSRMTEKQRVQLKDGISEADRGEVVDGEEAFKRLGARFGFKHG